MSFCSPVALMGQLRLAPFWHLLLLIHVSKAWALRTYSRLVPKMSTQVQRPLLLGLNKYTHDVSAALICLRSGKVVAMTEKERSARAKHAAGEVTEDLIQDLLSIGKHSLNDIQYVVQQNHHWRIKDFEKRLPWAVAQSYYSDAFLDEHNLFPHVPPTQKHEISHHLAHAYSVFPQAPFTKGLIVVMDGMGEKVRIMEKAARNKDSYTSDLSSIPKHPAFLQVPEQLDDCYDYREAESAYVFDGSDLQLLFKRYTREHSPPELFNHGFADMESLGAIYSRLASHIMGNWNACGKVMGLASYGRLTGPRIFTGDLLNEQSFRVDWQLLRDLKWAGPWEEQNKERTSYCADLAARVQRDLEEVVVVAIQHWKDATGSSNLCLAGGVFQNSMLVGRVVRELGFEKVFIPPYPGDEGISIGAAYWGAYSSTSPVRAQLSGIAWEMPHKPISAYQGRDHSDDIDAALAASKSFLAVQELDNMEAVIEAAVTELVQGRVVAWYSGRSEVGPRALGARSLLADPRRKEMVGHLNQVKSRESFRPFAPSVLYEDAEEWFEDLRLHVCDSAYMSLTVPVKRAKRTLVPAICHIDGTARLQVVRRSDSPWYYRLIELFKARTGIPMIVNTSFNTLPGEPIVESPVDAIRSFLHVSWGVNALLLGTRYVRARESPFRIGGPVGQLIPQRAPNLLLEETLRELDGGEARNIRIARGQARGGKVEWLELQSELDLIVLSLVDGEASIAEIGEVAAELLGIENVALSDLMASLDRLYRTQLVFC